jgi:hypothetical protein
VATVTVPVERRCTAVIWVPVALSGASATAALLVTVTGARASWEIVTWTV